MMKQPSNYPNQGSAKPNIDYKKILNSIFDPTKREIPKENFVDEAQALATKIKLNKTQLRKFYDEFKRYDMIINTKDDFSSKKALLAMIKAKIYYHAERNKIKEFANFINNAIDFFVKDIKNDEEGYNKFKVFMKFFEAFYCFEYES